MRRLQLPHHPSITYNVLQINSSAATSSCWEADLLDESKKTPPRPSWRTQPPSFQYDQQPLSVYKGTHINTITCWGWHVCTLTEKEKKKTYNLSPHGLESLHNSTWGWSQKANLTRSSWRCSSTSLHQTYSSSTCFHFAQTKINWLF